MRPLLARAPLDVSLKRGRQSVRYALIALSLMAAGYALLYFPYPPTSFPVRALTFYLHVVASASALGSRVLDRTVAVSGDLVYGRFSLRIVLDCAALDAHVLYAAAVAAFPVVWSRRVLGILVGSTLIAATNIARIVALYAAGLYWPGAFHVLHEEVFQFGIVLVALLTFLGWLGWARSAPAS